MLLPVRPAPPWIRLRQWARGKGQAWSQHRSLLCWPAVRVCGCVCVRVRVAYRVRGVQCEAPGGGQGEAAPSRRAGCWPGSSGGPPCGEPDCGLQRGGRRSEPIQLLWCPRLGRGRLCDDGAWRPCPFQPGPRKPYKCPPPPASALASPPRSWGAARPSPCQGLLGAGRGSAGTAMDQADTFRASGSPGKSQTVTMRQTICLSYAPSLSSPQRP